MESTVYPFGPNGQLPRGVGLVDYTIGGWDKALAAEAGKQLYQMILQHTDTYSEVSYAKKYDNSLVDEQGAIIAIANAFIKEFAVDLVNNDYIASYGYGGTQAVYYTLNYYDENWNYLGGAVRNPGGEPLTKFTFAPLVFPSAWGSDIETYKARTKFVRIGGYYLQDYPEYDRPANLYNTWTIPQSFLPREVTPNVITIFASVIQSPAIYDGTNSNTEIATTPVMSPWGIVFPETYSIGGMPTPVIAMLHGSDGYVTGDVLGYADTNWVAQRNAYLSAGFAVMDINGYGASSQADEKSKHWGCPLAVETLDKAFEYLKKNYNVFGKLLLHGQSMGGCLAMSYTKCHPGKVAGVGLFAPGFLPFQGRFNDWADLFLAWGYADKAAAIADNFGHFTGYAPLNECQVIEGSGDALFQFDWNDYDDSTKATILTKKLVDKFPVQMRVWQGTADATIPKEYSKLLVSSLRRGNSPVSIRLCSGASHALASNEYVRNEAVSWFKRFVDTYSI